MTVKLKWVYSPPNGWGSPSYSLMMGSVKVASAFFDSTGQRGDVNRYRINMLVPGIQAKQQKWPTLVDAITIGQRVMNKWLHNAGLITNESEVEYDHTELDKHIKQPGKSDV